MMGFAKPETTYPLPTVFIFNPLLMRPRLPERTPTTTPSTSARPISCMAHPPILVRSYEPCNDLYDHVHAIVHNAVTPQQVSFCT